MYQVRTLVIWNKSAGQNLGFNQGLQKKIKQSRSIILKNATKSQGHKDSQSVDILQNILSETLRLSAFVAIDDFTKKS